MPERTLRALLLGAALLIALPVAASAPLVEADAHVEAEVQTSLGAPVEVGASAQAPDVEREASSAQGELDPDIVARAEGALDGENPLAPLVAQARLEASSRLAPGPGAVGTSQDATSAHALVQSLPEPVREAAAPALAAAGVLAVFQAFGWWRALGLGGVALYSRLSKSELLDNEHRDKVYKLVQAEPGIAMSEIGARLGIGWGTVVYHLDRLERVGFVASERSGMHRCWFPVGTVPRAAREGIGALKAETTRNVALFLVGRPGASQTDLCEGLGLSASAASKQVSKLEKAGLVRRERDWKTVHLFPEPTLGGLLGQEPAAQHETPTPPLAAVC